MTRRKWIILGAILLVLTIGAEFVVRPWNSSRGRVQVVNQGDTPMDDLVVSYGDTKVRLGTLSGRPVDHSLVHRRRQRER